MRGYSWVSLFLILSVSVSASSLIGDFNNDCEVNILDIILMVKQIGKDSPTHDLKPDGEINIFDIVLLVKRLNDKCGTIPSDAYLSDIQWVSATNGFGPVEKDSSNGEDAAGDGNTIKLEGYSYPKGLGVHAPSEIVYDLGGNYKTFLADVGIDDESGTEGSVVFEIWLDGVKKYDSGLRTGSSPTRAIVLDITGVNTLKLVVTDAGDNYNFDHADWADAQVTTQIIQPPPCACGDWADTSCGAGSCSSTQMQQQRTCSPNGCSTSTKCVTDTSCTTPITSDGIQWKPIELSFTSSGSPDWKSFPLQATFTHTSGTKHILDGYWDGGKSWKVRFAASKSGTWTWTSSSSDSGLNNKGGTLNIDPPTSSQKSINPNYKGHLKISNNNRYFTYADGTPFFFLGDTNWYAFTCRSGLGGSPCGNDNFYDWANNRDSKKFTAVMVRYISPWVSNEGGCLISSLSGCNDPAHPDNGDYSMINTIAFRSVDTRMQYLWDKGFVVAGHPDWILERSYLLSDAQKVSRYLYARYGAYNLVWSLTGEYDLPKTTSHWKDNNWNRLRQLGDYMKIYNDRAYKHPMSVHPSGTGHPDDLDPMRGSSSPRFHNEPWLDHNWVQTWHSIHKIPHMINQDYNLQPTKPVLMSEPMYENAVHHWDKWTAKAKHARFSAYNSLLYGASGHVYGAEGLWGMTVPSEINLPGSDDMKHVYNLFNSIDWWRLVPGCLLVNGDSPDLISYTSPSCAYINGNTYIAYIPWDNGGKTLKIKNLGTKQYNARWFDVQSGAYLGLGVITPNGGTWTIPNRPNNSEDWVVILN